MSYILIKEKSMSMLTLRIDDKLDSYLSELAASSGKTKSEIAREALSGHVFRARWDATTADVSRHARSIGFYTDDDVMRLCNEARAETRAEARAAAKLTNAPASTSASR
jgi:predicted transcriptional regulator